MAKFGLLVNVDACIGCQACFVACKEENQTAPGVAWNRIKRIEDLKARVINYFRVSCQHCDDPACMKVCPVKAIHKGQFGEVLVDDQKCIACHMCEKACPYGAPMFADPNAAKGYWPDKPAIAERIFAPHQTRKIGRAEHCTLCSHRLAAGQQPACVEHCPTGALRLVDRESDAAWLKAQSAGKEAMQTKPAVRYLSTYVDFGNVDLKTYQ